MTHQDILLEVHYSSICNHHEIIPKLRKMGLLPQPDDDQKSITAFVHAMGHFQDLQKSHKQGKVKASEFKKVQEAWNLAYPVFEEKLLEMHRNLALGTSLTDDIQIFTNRIAVFKNVSAINDSMKAIDKSIQKTLEDNASRAEWKRNEKKRKAEEMK